MNNTSTTFHVRTFYEIAEKYEYFVRSACKFEYSNEHGMSLALMKNLMDAESGLPLSFLQNHQTILQELRISMDRAFNHLRNRTRDESNLNVIEQLKFDLLEAKNGTQLIIILDRAYDLTGLN